MGFKRRYMGSCALLALCVSLTLLSANARAETGRFNLHVDPGVAFPPIGVMGDVGFDWQFRRGFALDARLGGGALFDAGDAAWLVDVTAGVRFRLFDDQRGYANEANGSIAGDFWIAPHLGVAVAGLESSFFVGDELFEGDDVTAAILLDAEVGYEMSIASPFCLGFFARPTVGFSVDGGFLFTMVAGISLSFEFQPMRDADTDRDGVTDPRDACPDTPSGASVDRRGCELDSDGDGVVDRLDRCPGTPRGVPVDSVGCEPDSDGDGVIDRLDQCPGTPAGSTVDERGCIPIPPTLVLQGIEFAFDSAEILPASEQVLLGAFQMLADNPLARVEISGHTDDQGQRDYNMSLSRARAQAVADWLIGHGIARDRLEVVGVGPDRPIAPNDTPENLARNRRIEFRHLNPGQ
jgi:outer membrane protein OmpA-like peptidoglycan-associated protein